MPYSETNIIPLREYTKRKNAPLDFFEIAYREVNRDEASEPSFTPPKPRYEAPIRSQSHLKDGAGLWNLFRHNVTNFVAEFKP